MKITLNLINYKIANFRLPSIRGPRDLTLGGVQKKVFTPNIPARRAKQDARYSNSPFYCNSIVLLGEDIALVICKFDT